MLLHILHAELEPCRAALYDAATREEVVLRAWQAGGVIAALPLADGRARGLLTFWLDAARLDAWRAGPDCAAVRQLLSRFAAGGTEPEELMFEAAAASADVFGTAERSTTGAPTPAR